MIRRVLASVGLMLMVGAITGPAALAQTPTSTTTTTSPSSTTPTTGAPADGDQPYLTLDSASPWVAPDGTWTASWTIAQEPPAGAELQYTIHQPLAGSDLRGALAAVLAGGALGPSLQNEMAAPLAGLRTDSKATLNIPIRSHSGSTDRLFVPNAGILPIGIDLVTADGTRLQHSVLFLDRLPATATHPALRVAPRIEVTSPPIVQVDGSSQVPSAGRQSLDSLIQLLRRQPTVPVTSTIDPELLAALKRSGDADDSSRLSQLRAVLKGRPVLRSTWVPLDLDSWATSGSITDLQTSLFAGQLATTAQTDTPTENRIWPADPTVGPGAVRALGELGVQHLILAPNQLEGTKDLGTDPGTTRRVTIDSGNGLDALVDDPTLTTQLADTSVSPGLSTHLLATELESIWFSTPAGVTPAVTLDLSAAPTDTAADVLDALAAGGNPTIVPSTVEDAFTAASAYQITSHRRSTPLTRKLVTPVGTHDVGPLSTYLGTLRRRAAAYHSTMGDTPGLAPLDDLLWVSQDRSFDDTGSRRYLDEVARRIDTDLAKIQPPPARSLTLTARTASLPLHITNGLDRPVSVLLRFRGTRLGLRGGATRTIRLTPGSHLVPLSVVVRTSGEFTMTVQMRTADNSTLLSESTVRIRSTVVSGVGVFLGGGALLFLVIWWAMSIRRDRRAKAAGAGGITPPVDEPASVA